MVANIEDARFSTLRYVPKREFCHGDVGDGSGGMNAICSRREVAVDVTSGIDVEPPGITLV